MPPAARTSDMHTCPMATPATPPVPHVGGPVLPPGAPTVLIGGLPAARVGDKCICTGGGIPDPIIKGSATVMVSGMPAARMSDTTAHGGLISAGCPTVLIGDAVVPVTVAGGAPMPGGATGPADLGGGADGQGESADAGAGTQVETLAGGNAMPQHKRQADTLRRAARSGAAFCEVCDARDGT